MHFFLLQRAVWHPNRGKSQALWFGAFASDLQGEVEWIAAVKVLGVMFHASGEVARETWTGIVKKAEKSLSVAAQFQLSFTERSFVIKACVSSAIHYTTRIARPPRDVVRKLETKFFSFFWEGKRESGVCLPSSADQHGRIQPPVYFDDKQCFGIAQVCGPYPKPRVRGR